MKALNLNKCYNNIYNIRLLRITYYKLCLITYFIITLPILAQSSAANALWTDGVDDYAYPLTSNAASLTEGTLELWFSANSWGPHEQLWGGGIGLPGTKGDFVKLGTHTSLGTQDLAFGRYFDAWQWISTGNQPELGSWYHVAVTWSSNNFKLYLNGKLIGTNDFVGTFPNYSTEIIASSSWEDYFDGAIDEIRIWNIARDSSAIASTFLDTLGPAYYTTEDSGLIAYYRMDILEDLDINSDGADDLRDLSVNENHLDTEGDPNLEPSGAFVVTDLNDKHIEIPFSIELNQNYPNPFNPTTNITYSLPAVDDVTLKIFNLAGQEIRTLFKGRQAAGKHIISWDGKNNSGISVASGVYIYRIRMAGFVESKKMLLLR